MSRPGPPPPVQRLDGADRMQWEADVGPFPQHIGAVLLLDPGSATTDDWVGAIATRLGGVSILGRRPVRPPFGGGSWIWVDDDRDPYAHVGVVRLDGSDDQAVLDRGVDLVGQRLSRRRSPWRALVLADPEGQARALVVVLHHTLADGLSGLSVLAALLDGVPVTEPTPPAPVPPRSALVRDAWERRLDSLRRAPATLATIRAGWDEMGGVGTPRAPRSGLNRPTGPRRELAAVAVDLSSVRSAAHRWGGTVNDAVLVAVGATLGRVQRDRGERLSDVVLSVPVAVTDPEVRARVGNAVGAIRMPVPTEGDLADRLRTVAAGRRDRLAGQHGRSLPLILASFRVLSVAGQVRRFTERQRMVTSLVTNMRGPDQPLTVLGARVRGIVPIVANQGNQAVSFAVLSYRGILTVAVTTDPDLGLHATSVADVLAEELGSLADAGRTQRKPADRGGGP